MTDDEKILEKWHSLSKYPDSKSLKSDYEAGAFSNFINAFEKNFDIDSNRPWKLLFTSQW